MKMVVLVMLLSGCAGSGYHYAKIGVGHHDSAFSENPAQWENGDGVGANVSVGYVEQLGGDWWIDWSYEHYSQWDANQPLEPPDTRDETSLDRVGVSVEWRF